MKGSGGDDRDRAILLSCETQSFWHADGSLPAGLKTMRVFVSVMRGRLLVQLTIAADVVAASLSGELKGEQWEGTDGALAKLLLLDQFPRTAFR